MNPIRWIRGRFRQIKKLPTWIFWVPAALIKSYKIFVRTRLVDPGGHVDLKKLPYISVTWHNRLLFFPALIEYEFRKITYALVSPSRDGQYLTDLLSHFQVKTIRGSTSKRAAGALLESIQKLGQGFSLSITPDGPRGPRYVMSAGPIVLASKTGIPILPLSINASAYWELKSWDRFQIPKPFSTIELVVSEPIHVPPGLDADGIEEWRQKIEKALMDITPPENVG